MNTLGNRYRRGTNSVEMKLGNILVQLGDFIFIINYKAVSRIISNQTDKYRISLM